jgi:tyrosine decarboxylase/aspartate 1-decarboxylase
MDTHGMDEKTIGSILYDLKSKDTPYERVLSSMCTYPHPVAVAAHQRFIETNLGDPGLFAGTAEIEQEVVRMMGALFGNPDAHGYITTGGTESNIQAIHAIKSSTDEISALNTGEPEPVCRRPYRCCEMDERTSRSTRLLTSWGSRCGKQTSTRSSEPISRRLRI